MNDCTCGSESVWHAISCPMHPAKRPVVSVVPSSRGMMHPETFALLRDALEAQMFETAKWKHAALKTGVYCGDADVSTPEKYQSAQTLAIGGLLDAKEALADAVKELATRTAEREDALDQAWQSRVTRRRFVELAKAKHAKDAATMKELAESNARLRQPIDKLTDNNNQLGKHSNVIMEQRDQVRGQANKAMALIADCPLLHTSTCNAAELAWIGKATMLLEDGPVPKEAGK